MLSIMTTRYMLRSAQVGGGVCKALLVPHASWQGSVRTKRGIRLRGG